MYSYMMQEKGTHVINVKYVAPFASTVPAPHTQSYSIDPYTMFAIRPGCSAYVVAAQADWPAAGITESDLLVVDECAVPTDGGICIFAVDDTLQICTVHNLDGTLQPLPMGSKIEKGAHVEFCGTVVRMMRMLHD